jgi:acyl transferase domain-containing protein/thioester reductase-like protein/acyl carrier protein
MSIKVAGANDLESFWDVLCSGKSQHREVPKERFSFGESIFRDAVDPSRKWFANVIHDPADFDHHFFKKSPRESAAMDPQQRHMLQIAYQAVEMSGYFRHRPGPGGDSPEEKRRVGCFVGCSTCDYEQNVACHNASAFSATGQLRAFVAGKVSHFFGWTGPSVTVDTACSSSAVAVHQACQSILTGDCNSALAGGSFVMAGPQWFEDLSAASFLSPTGQCKPFDAAADGYCRGEAVAAVFLKRLDYAIAHGDEVLGVIGATSVQQNENCTSIFVPNEPSLSNLFETVLGKAGLQPGDISVMEAHGTGTAIGDPAEYGAIRRVLGGLNRRRVTRSCGGDKPTTPLYLGSVKGSVGHTECTAGVVSLIKVVLMLNKGIVPPQASFDRLSTSLHATPEDEIVINTRSAKLWDAEFKAALVSSYGASGSNTCILVKQMARDNKATIDTTAGFRGAASSTTGGHMHLPFWLSANDDEGLRRYAQALRRFIFLRRTNDHCDQPVSLTGISIAVSRQKSRLLNRSLFLKANSLDDLQEKLASYENGASPSLNSVTRPASKPVIFCFGGQISKIIGLDRAIFEGTFLLRKHLSEVDAITRSEIPGGIIHVVLDKSPQDDPVKLQVALFALQYASARTWMDSGIEPVAVVGHSFGEISALCVSGVLSLGDAVRLVVSRATLIRDAWGADKGAMLAIEADLRDAQELVEGSDGGATIACYNAPRTFTVGGSTAAIAQIERTISTTRKPIKAKRLDVSHAFHSPLVDPLVEKLDQCARDLKFHKPRIHMERSIEVSSEREQLLGPQFVSRHMRDPVYFHHAMERLADKYQQYGAIFLESGSNSTIMNMASRALGERSSRFNFQAINITTSTTPTPAAEYDPSSVHRCWNRLVDATMDLWAAGAVNLQFWAHHPLQPSPDRAPLLLPPYQFEPARHWLDRIPPSRLLKSQALGQPGEGRRSETVSSTISANGMISFGALISPGENTSPPSKCDKLEGLKHVLFRVVTESPKYRRLVEGHKMAYTAGICPATVQIDLVIEALCMTLPRQTAGRKQQSGREGSGASLSELGLQPQVSDVVCYIPLTCNPLAERLVWIEIPPVSYNCNLLRDYAKSMETVERVCPGDAEDLKQGDDHAVTEFTFEVFSTDPLEEQDWALLLKDSPIGKRTKHTTGKIKLVHRYDKRAAKDFAQFSRLISNTQVTQLLQDTSAENSISHKGVYFMFESIVQYCDEYCGIQRLVSSGNQTAAIVRPPNAQQSLRPRRPEGQDDFESQHDAGSWFQPCVADTFAQTAGMWLNCLAPDLERDQLFVFNGFDQWVRAPSDSQSIGSECLQSTKTAPSRPAVMHILATQHRTSSKTAVSDVFVFDASTGRMFEAVLGIGWSKVPRSQMQETLARLSGTDSMLKNKSLQQKLAGTVPHTSISKPPPYPLEGLSARKQSTKMLNYTMPAPATPVSSFDIHTKIKEVLAELSGLDRSSITDNCELVNLGIDSLMNMELASEIRSAFKVATSESDLMRIVQVSDLVEYVEDLLGCRATATLATAPLPEISSQVKSYDEQSLSSDSGGDSSATSHGGNSTNSSSTASVSTPLLLSPRDYGKESRLKGVFQSPEQLAEREATVDSYIRTLTQDWATPLEKLSKTLYARSIRGCAVVAVTGGTGGLGAHLVARLSCDPGVARVICLNRPNEGYHDPTARQIEAVRSKVGLDLSQHQHAVAASKLRVLETDLSRPMLGLGPAEYAELSREVTHVVHNSWKMSLAHGLAHFEPQLRTMQRLLHLARDAALSGQNGVGDDSRCGRVITFQFVSSIAVVGQHPLVRGSPGVAEERVGIESVLPAGYADAKWACERMLDETLHRWPGLFRPMVVRLGQIAASQSSGYWNTAEHVPFIIKSSQTLGVLPNLGGTLGWTPVDNIAGSLADLLFVGEDWQSGFGGNQARPYPIYNIDNPGRTPWRDMMTVLADALRLDPSKAIISWADWVQRVREHGLRVSSDVGSAENPAFLLIDFLEANFERISCGGLLLETCHTREHSSTMRGVKPFSHELARLFVQKWRDMGFIV